jgi:hypothetical protein
MLQRLRENGFGTGIARFVPILKEELDRSQVVDFKHENIGHRVQSRVRHPDVLHTKRHICSQNMQIF